MPTTLRRFATEQADAQQALQAQLAAEREQEQDAAVAAAAALQQWGEGKKGSSGAEELEQFMLGMDGSIPASWGQ